jgi:hypothetical protein
MVDQTLLYLKFCLDNRLQEHSVAVRELVLPLLVLEMAVALHLQQLLAQAVMLLVVKTVCMQVAILLVVQLPLFAQVAAAVVQVQ